MILVTGGTGFVGRHVVQALLAAGKDVRALVRDPKKGASLGGEVVEGDMTDAASLRRAVEGIDVVVHLVAIRQGKPELFQRVMVEGTRNLLAAATEAGVRRFVLMSALGTSEESKDLVPYYGAKWQMEQDVKASGLPYVIFRPSFIFERDGGILPTFRKLAKLTPVTPIIGSGEQRIQPIWAGDVAAYFDSAIDLDAATGRTERLPGSIPLTRDLLKMLEHADNVVTNDDAVQTFQLPLVPLDEQLRRAA